MRRAAEQSEKLFAKGVEMSAVIVYNRILVIFMVQKTFGVALDGPSGSGKSTLARLVAQRYGFVYLDTGSLYRAVGYYIAQKGIDPRDNAAVCAALPGIKLDMRLENGGSAVYLDGVRLGTEIRTPEISAYASAVSAIPQVREFLLSVQRGIAERRDVVMDGRDIGTVILPDARVKIFITASPEERAARRFRELSDRGENVVYEDILARMKERDFNDRNRDIAPTVPAEDAVIIDNTGMSAQQTLEAVADIIDKERARK